MPKEEMASFDEKIKVLKHARKLCFEALTRFSVCVNSFSDVSRIFELQARLEKVQSLWVEFISVQGDLELYDTTTDHSDKRINFEDIFFESTGKAKSLIDKHLVSQNQLINPNQNALPPQSHNMNASLPKIKLPEFHGSYDQWLQFSDTYKSLIHINSTISNIEKFWYLKSCLKGDAANVLNSLEVSETNYNKAWDILCQRYENKKVIIQTHLKALNDIENVTKESHVSLRNLIDVSVQHLRALESLGLPVQSWDTLVIFNLTSKLDSVTRREWEDYFFKLSTDTPSLQELISFLNKRCQILENINANKPSTSRGFPPPKVPNKSGTFLTTDSANCILCNKNHLIFYCSEFSKLSPQDRLNKIRKLRACTNCLRLGHSSKDCKSTYSCRRCKLRHNTLLHLSSPSNSSGEIKQIPPNDSSTAHCSTETFVNNSQTLSVINSDNDRYILLSTAKITVFDVNGESHTCRALLDNCSQSNFITKSLFDKLGLTSSNVCHTVEGFGNTVTKILQKSSIKIKSIINSFSVENIPCLITEKITKNLPDVTFSFENLNIPKNIILADNDFNKSGPIDLLIGASIFWDLICVGQIKLSNNSTILQKTKLGWIVSGPLSLPNFNSSVCNLTTNNNNSEINKQLEKFWLLEECKNKNQYSREETECEEHFIKTTTRDDSGRFVVSLPIKDNLNDLSNSFDIALKRFYATEKRLNKNSEFKSEYKNFMSEYEKLGHMSKINSSSICDNNYKEFYLPHHGVIRESSSTTKLRVVFDGSVKTFDGLSLNDCLKVGPKIQDDLMDIVIRFRLYKFAFTADIEKMYRCVMIKENERSLQKILWRSNDFDKIEEFQLNTVTYGTSSASYLAVRCLQQIAIENKEQFPKAHDIIMSSFYVDDLLSGSNSIEEGKLLISEIIYILKSAGFNLRKWVANNEQLLTEISNNEKLLNKKFISDDKTIKTLGLVWNSEKDIFKYTVNVSPCLRITKRTILAVTAQIFDPLGLVGPCIIRAKIMLQIIWQLGLDWDESVPMAIHDSWSVFCSQIPTINSIEIPRHFLIENSAKIEIHGFSDASQKAYGACCYIVSKNCSGNSSTFLVCAKSKVAPIKTITLPRLELCAAQLLVKLTQRIINSLKIHVDEIHYWTDSTIVLSWISLEPNQLNTFVANRISNIQQFSSFDQWHHVPSEFNPADIISRGLDPEKLKGSNLWWFGPSFLKEPKEIWSQNTPTLSTDPPETKRTKLTLVLNHHDDTFIENYSSFVKLQRINAYCLRFLFNLREKNNDLRRLGSLSKVELNQSTIILCKIVQSNNFSDELKMLKTSSSVSCKSSILRLNPFLDQDSLIRVGGRLSLSNFSFNQKHPILLPSNCHLTRLIIIYEHLRHLHAGAQATLSAVRSNFWPINGRNIVQKILRNCVTCFRANPTPAVYQMGTLPKARVTPQRPFYITGVDFAGPFMVKDGKAKNRILVKCYLSIFVCFATKAVHFELAGDLSSECFLNCLKRFVSRRGICSEIYSDNGTNFVGAEKELRNVVNKLKGDAQISNFLSINNITWHFSPPHGPNFGGLWEASVKSAKFHLKRIVGNAHLTYESLLTVFVQIEAVLNSRPLIALSNDPNDMQALTPSHFLIGESLMTLPQYNFEGICENRLKLYERLQKQVQHFWRRWSDSYLHTLQERSKWKKSYPNVKLDSLVLIKDDNASPLHWKLGRIVELFPGKDNITRVVSVKTPSGLLKRPVSKICPLPTDS